MSATSSAKRRAFNFDDLIATGADESTVFRPFPLQYAISDDIKTLRPFSLFGVTWISPLGLRFRLLFRRLDRRRRRRPDRFCGRRECQGS